MTPQIHGKLPGAQFWLRTLVCTSVTASVLFSIWASRLLTDFDESTRKGFPHDHLSRIAGDVDPRNWNGTISRPIPLEEISGIRSDQKWLDLQPFHYFSIPKGKVTDVHLATVAKAPWLEELRLAETCITDEGVRYLTAMTSLRVLRLARTKISDRALEYLASLRKLEMLDLDGTYVTEQGSSHLVALDALRVLRLGNTKISDAALEHISTLAALEDIYLNNDEVGDDGLRHLALLPKLEYLDLRATQVTDEGLKILRQFPALQLVRLDRCPISDAGIIHLSDVRSLELVDLYGAKYVTAGGVARLKELRPDLAVCWQEPTTEH